MNNKCKCGNYVPIFSTNQNYCSKACEEKGGSKYGVDDLMKMFGMK